MHIVFDKKKTYSHVDNTCRITSCHKEEKFGPIILAYVKPPFCYWSAYTKTRKLSGRGHAC